MGKTVTEQHKAPCKTCPFTSNVKPGELGGSPPEVYVAQHFLPFKVPCHECVDYENNQGDPEHGWKDGALEAAQCVGFAMTRNGDGVDEIMPEGLLHAEYDDSKTIGAFKDIFDFWAFHNRISRVQAIVYLTPQTMLRMCGKEVERPGYKHLWGREGAKEEMFQTVAAMISRTWMTAVTEELVTLEARCNNLQEHLDAADQMAWEKSEQ